MVDLTLIGAVILLVIVIIHQSAGSMTRIFISTLAGAGILFLAGVADHLTDIGMTDMIYLTPVAYFILYGVLSAGSLKKMIEHLHQSTELAVEERKWRLFIQDVKVIVVELNTMGHIRYVNPYFLELTGFKMDEVLGKDWFELVLPPNYSYDVQSAFIEILANDFHPHYQNPIVTKYEQEKMISWYNVRTRDMKGKISGSISIGVDITGSLNENQALEKSLQEAREVISRLEQKISNP
jgi:PAS domain S-box-containing protein